MQPVAVTELRRFNNVLEITTTKPEGFIFDPGDYTQLGAVVNGKIDKRWMSIANPPSAKKLRFITKIPAAHTDYKAHLSQCNIGDELLISPAIGNFNVPKNRNNKLLFIAEGIGITPYLSLIPSHYDSYDISVIYAQKHGNFYFKDELTPVKKQFFYTGTLTLGNVLEYVDNIDDYVTYLAGSQDFCLQLEEGLLHHGVQRHHIKLEYFEGY